MNELIAVLKLYPLLGIIGLIVVVCVAGWFWVRYQITSQLGKTVAVYKGNSEAQEALIKTKDETIAVYEKRIAELSRSIEELKAELKASERLFQRQLDELKGKIELLSDENSAYRTSKLRADDRIETLERLLTETREGCTCEFGRLNRGRINEALHKA